LNLFKEQLIVSSIQNILLGKIVKLCGCCPRNLILIENESAEQILRIEVERCQVANLCPRVLRCSSNLVYRIIDSKDKEVGTITNLSRGCVQNFFCLRDDFEINFTGTLR